MRIKMPCGSETRGVAVDSNHKVWVADKNGKVYRINPQGGAVMASGDHLGFVDMIVDLDKN